MLYLIGKIMNTHGIKGELKVTSSTDFDRFKKQEVVYIDNQPYTIKTVRKQKKIYIISFETLNTLNDVLFLKGKEIYTDQEPKLNEDEFHLPKLIGLDVKLLDGTLIGVVESVEALPQGYYLRIKKLNQHRTILIPFLKVFVKSVEDAIYIDPIEGLIEWKLILSPFFQTSSMNF